MLDGVQIGSANLNTTLGLGGAPGRLRLRVQIRSNGRVRYFINDVLHFESATSMATTGAHPVIFYWGQDLFAPIGMEIDNVVVTAP